MSEKTLPCLFPRSLLTGQSETPFSYAALLIRKSLTKENPVKVPFILMSKAQGVQLKTLGWDSDLRNPEAPHLSATHKSRIMTRLGEIVSKLNDLRFDKLGSVVESDGEYSVGECLAPPFIFHDREFLGNINRGPFNSDKEYYDALLDVYARHLEELPLSSNVFFSGPKPKQRDFAKWEDYTSASMHGALA